jgi:hypothetical protein
MTGSDHTIRARYADLLDDENDPADIRLLAYLEAGYTSVTVPPALEYYPSGPAVSHAGRRAGLAVAGRPGRWRIHQAIRGPGGRDSSHRCCGDRRYHSRF